MQPDPHDQFWMRVALQLAARGLGQVEPNPMVGCVLVRDGKLIGRGWHARYGGPHAEINAIADANQSVAGCTAYVTLEPCSHFGKTPPCADALIRAGIRRVVIACLDPFPQVNGTGAERLRAAGIEVVTGILGAEAEHQLAPYLKRVRTGLPWIIAKWAMTWDGKIATACGDSKWISNEACRRVVHELRGRVDGIMVGANTVEQDDPLLNARPSGLRTATRIVVDSRARIGLDSQLCRTAKELPTLIAVGREADEQKLNALAAAGCEIWRQSEPTLTADHSLGSNAALIELLSNLAQRGMTNILVEGGGILLGSLHDLSLIDEVHVFIGAKLLGGANALTPIAGQGVSRIIDSQSIQLCSTQALGQDVYLIGRTIKPQTAQQADRGQA